MIKYLLMSIYERIRTSEIEEEFRNIGVSFRDNMGNYRDSIVIMNEVAITMRVMLGKRHNISAIYYIDKFVGLRNRNLFMEIFDIKLYNKEI